MCSPSAPEPTDPQETASAQTGTNINTAVANTIMGNMDQYTPDGSVTYSYGDTNTPQIEQYTIAGTPGTPAQPGQGNVFGLPFGAGQDAVAGTPDRTGYRVGGQEFDTYEAALEYQQSLPGYDPNSTYSWVDSNGVTHTVPRGTVTQTLSPEGQVIHDNNTQTQTNLSELASDQSAFLNDYMTEPFAYDPGQHENWALNLYDQINGDSLAASQERLRTQLANQGIGIGSEAYDRAMSGMYEGQQGARDQFMLNSYGQGMQTALTNRNQPINEIIGLLNGSQVQQPNFLNPNTSQIPTTDYAAIVANADAAEMAAWQQNQAAGGSLFSGLGGLFQGLGSAGLTLSDERAKTDKEKIGETKDGLGLYSFKYKGSDKTEIGLMAQEVKKKKPGAVKTMPTGLMAVDYGKALN